MDKNINYSNIDINELERAINEKIKKIEQDNDDKCQSMKLGPTEDYNDGLELFDDNYYQRSELVEDGSELITPQSNEQERMKKLKELREYRDYCERIRNSHSQGMHM